MASELVIVETTEVEVMRNDGTSLIESAKAMARAIMDGPSLQRAADMMLEAKRRVKAIKERFKDSKAAAKKAHTEICELESSLIEPYERVETEIIKPAMAAFEMEQDRKRRAQEELMIAQAKKKAEDERLAAAAELERAGEKETAQALMDAPVEIAPVVQPRIDTPQGISYRDVWKYRIISAPIVPDEFWVIDEKRIADRVRSMKGETRIPGVEVWVEKAIAGRV